MKFVDVHCHLEDERFSEDLDKVIERAKSVGVSSIFVAGANPEANREILKLAKKHSILRASFGLYPIDAVIAKFPGLTDDYPRKITPFDFKEELDWIRKNKDVCIAVGEVGLELKVVEGHKDFDKIKQAQIEVFEEAIKLARGLDKPLVIHTRGGELDVIEILEKYKYSKVILHCFGGKKSLIKRAADNGWYFSIPAVIKRLDHFKTLVGMVDLKQLLTETDAPYLAPVAGERSEPKDVVGTVDEIAKIKCLTKEEVAKQIWSNAEKLFGKI